MIRKFECVRDCSECCIKREYYPSKRFGKIGVLILPGEKNRIEKMAGDRKIKVTILPRIGLSDAGAAGPEKILAYQMMGRQQNGDVCPFLDTDSPKRSPHNGFTCMIYNERPLACRAYPVIESDPLELDSKCTFCRECGSAGSNLDSEIAAISEIKAKMQADGQVWRYATGTGEAEDRRIIQTGWIRV